MQPKVVKKVAVVTFGLVAACCYAMFAAYRHGMDLNHWPPRPVPGSPHPGYSITDLGPVGAFDINNSGQITGMTEFRPGYYPGYKPGVAYGFVWSSGRRTEIRTFGGPSSGGDKINDQGQVLGEAETRHPDPKWPLQQFAWCPFLWNDGKMMDLSRLPGYQSVEARAFAPDGRILVCAVPAGVTDRHIYLYNGKTMADLGKLPRGVMTVMAINRRSQVIGSYTVGQHYSRNLNGPSSVQHAFLWKQGKFHDLGTLGGAQSQAEAINDKGQIVGYSDLKVGQYHAFLWEHGKMRDLGTLLGTSLNISSAYPSRADGINNKGQIVGYSVAPTTGDFDGFIWENGQMKDLSKMVPQSHWYGLDGGWFSIGGAVAINEKGQIIGEGGKIGDNHNHSYLLTPIK